MTTAAELHRLGSKLRSQGATRGDWLTYIDGTLPFLRAAMTPKAAPECPVCESRRKAKAASQKRWRAGKRRTSK
jgi:hypothetical protein